MGVSSITLYTIVLLTHAANVLSFPTDEFSERTAMDLTGQTRDPFFQYLQSRLPNKLTLETIGQSGFGNATQSMTVHRTEQWSRQPMRMTSQHVFADPSNLIQHSHSQVKVGNFK